MLPTRFAHPIDPGLIRPEALAVAKDGSLLIADTYRDELFRRAPGRIAARGRPDRGMEGDGRGRAERSHIRRRRESRPRARRTAPSAPCRSGSSRLTSLAFAPDGTLYVGANESIVAVAPNGSTRTVFRTGGKSHQIVVRGRRFGGFEADNMTVGGNGDLYVFSFSGKTIFEITPSGKPLHVWVSYAHGLATAPDGSVIIGTQFGAVQRLHDGKLSTVADL